MGRWRDLTLLAQVAYKGSPSTRSKELASKQNNVGDRDQTEVTDAMPARERMNVPEWAAALIAESDRREDEVKRLLPMLAEARRYYFASKKTDADRLQLDAVEAEPAVACVVGRWKSVVTADAARAIGQDRRQDRSPRPVDCHPVCCAA